MREKLRGQRETVISLPKPWDSRRNRETWQECCSFSMLFDIYSDTTRLPYPFCFAVKVNIGHIDYLLFSAVSNTYMSNLLGSEMFAK